MIGKLIKGALIGGLIYFIWTIVSWVALPWHKLYLSKVPNEANVSIMLKSEIPQSGLYFILWHPIRALSMNMNYHPLT